MFDFLKKIMIHGDETDLKRVFALKYLWKMLRLARGGGAVADSCGNVNARLRQELEQQVAAVPFAQANGCDKNEQVHESKAGCGKGDTLGNIFDLKRGLFDQISIFSVFYVWNVYIVSRSIFIIFILYLKSGVYNSGV